MKAPKLTRTATKITVTRNGFGDVVYGATSSSPCLYRDISILENNNNLESVNVDGYMWFGANEVLAKGDVYLLGSKYYRIEKITAGRDLLLDDAIRFYKCEVMEWRQVS